MLKLKVFLPSIAPDYAPPPPRDVFFGPVSYEFSFFSSEILRPAVRFSLGQETVKGYPPRVSGPNSMGKTSICNLNSGPSQRGQAFLNILYINSCVI